MRKTRRAPYSTSPNATVNRGVFTLFDRHLIPVIRSPLTQLAKPLCRAGVSANQVSLTGFAIGMLALPLLALAAINGRLRRSCSTACWTGSMAP